MCKRRQSIFLRINPYNIPTQDRIARNLQEQIIVTWGKCVHVPFYAQERNTGVAGVEPIFQNKNSSFYEAEETWGSGIH